MCTTANDHGRNILLPSNTIVGASGHFKSGALGESARCEGGRGGEVVCAVPSVRLSLL